MFPGRKVSFTCVSLSLSLYALFSSPGPVVEELCVRFVSWVSYNPYNSLKAISQTGMGQNHSTPIIVCMMVPSLWE